MTYLIVKLRMADIMKRLSKTAKLMRSLWKVSPNSFLVNTMMIVVLPKHMHMQMSIVLQSSFFLSLDLDGDLPRMPIIPTMKERTPSTQKEKF